MAGRKWLWLRCRGQNWIQTEDGRELWIKRLPYGMHNVLHLTYRGNPLNILTYCAPWQLYNPQPRSSPWTQAAKGLVCNQISLWNLQLFLKLWQIVTAPVSGQDQGSAVPGVIQTASQRRGFHLEAKKRPADFAPISNNIFTNNMQDVYLHEAVCSMADSDSIFE